MIRFIIFDVVYVDLYNYISFVYSPFSDGVGLPLHNINSPGVLMNSIGVEVLRPDALPGVTCMGCNIKYFELLHSGRNSTNTVV